MAGFEQRRVEQITIEHLLASQHASKLPGNVRIGDGAAVDVHTRAAAGRTDHSPSANPPSCSARCSAIASRSNDLVPPDGCRTRLSLSSKQSIATQRLRWASSPVATGLALARFRIITHPCREPWSRREIFDAVPHERTNVVLPAGELSPTSLRSMNGMPHPRAADLTIPEIKWIRSDRPAADLLSPVVAGVDVCRRCRTGDRSPPQGR